MKPYWKPQHEVFIRCMLKHEDPTKAYHTAYPKAKIESARVGGIRLYGYPHIRQRIEPVIRERRLEAHKRSLEEGAERERRQNERRMEMRRVLYKVVMKKLQRQRVFVIKGRTVTFVEDPPTNTILNAMVLDLRLEAGYDNWPVIERRFARILASLLPREKREQTVINSMESSIVPVISTAGRNLLKRSDVASCKSSGDFSLRSTALRSVRNDALISEQIATANSFFPLESHANGNMINYGGGVRQALCVSGVCRRTRKAGFTNVQKTEQTVTKVRAKPAPAIIAAYTKATIQPAIVTKAEYKKVYPPPDIGFSSKSV